MTRRLYTEEQHAFIQANTQGRTARQLSSLVEEKLGIAFTPNMAKSYRANHHLQSGPVEDREMYSSLFPKEICVYIRENYKGCGPKEMAERLNDLFRKNYTRANLKAFYANHGLDSGLDGKFKKGSVPATKGLTWSQYGSMEKHERSRATQFKQGGLPPNTSPIGTVAVREGYEWEKIAEPNIWKARHIMAWEKERGPVPEGQMIIFLDGNRRNISLDNLMLVSGSENLCINRQGMRFEDPDLTKSAALIAKISSRVSKLEKKEVF